MNKVLLTALVGAVLVLTANPLSAQDVTGDWQGTLHAGPVDLRIQLHITKSDKGFAATMDSVDQGAKGIPVDSVTFDGSTLKFSVALVQGTYEGKVGADSNSVSGNWTQPQLGSAPLAFTRGTFKTVEHKPAPPSDIDGKWTGTLDTPNGSLHVVFNIVNTQDGLTATAESPDQGVSGIPVTGVTRNGSSLKFEIKGLAAVYEGVISPDLKTVTGTLNQAGNTLPLVLKH